MKYILVFIAAFFIGYFSYEMLHPVDIQASKRARSEKAPVNCPPNSVSELKTKKNEENAPEGKALQVSVTVQPEKKVTGEIPQKAASIQQSLPENKEKKKLTPEEKETQRKFFMTIWKQPYLDVKDSRVQKLIGSFKGKLERLGASRTGLLENITFQVNQDPEKGMTKFEVIDVYDNTTFNYYEPTVQSFRSVPGDENTLVISKNNELILFNMKTFPKIEGQLYNQQSQQLATFNLRKTK